MCWYVIWMNINTFVNCRSVLRHRLVHVQWSTVLHGIQILWYILVKVNRLQWAFTICRYFFKLSRTSKLSAICHSWNTLDTVKTTSFSVWFYTILQFNVCFYAILQFNVCFYAILRFVFIPLFFNSKVRQRMWSVSLNTWTSNRK